MVLMVVMTAFSVEGLTLNEDIKLDGIDVGI